MEQPIVKFEQVSFRYEEDGPYALEDVSFSINRGEWLAIVGHNGSGKSTIAKLMNGLLFPEKGTISIKDFSLSEETIWEARKVV
ncbi:MAG TPA: ATP-binding cassette domain-containing protein, partial [Bacillota bacterium]|nr:ATP-binding cassette domain-containing protein [Bacillota bacterium]